MSKAKVNRDVAKLEKIIKELYAISKKHECVNMADVHAVAHDIEDYLIEPMALSIIDVTESEPLIMVKK